VIDRRKKRERERERERERGIVKDDDDLWKAEKRTTIL
jgi:hypothetical protein